MVLLISLSRCVRGREKLNAARDVSETEGGLGMCGNAANVIVSKNYQTAYEQQRQRSRRGGGRVYNSADAAIPRPRATAQLPQQDS